MLTICIPMAGEGSRFRNNHFIKPKPFINVGGKPMIWWIVQNLFQHLPQIETRIVFVLRNTDQRFQSQLESIVHSFRQVEVQFVIVDRLTEGAACTVLLAKQYFDGPLLIANSDQYVEWDARFYQQCFESDYDGQILCFYRKNDPKWSYVQVDAKGRVTEIREKEPISEHASVGIYFWKRGQDYVKCAEQMIEKNLKVNQEFYVAPVYNQGIEQGLNFGIGFCDRMWGLGVPEDLSAFCYQYLLKKNVHQIEQYLPYCQYPCIISHRGYLNGPDAKIENHPVQINKLLPIMNVEIDVRYIDGKWWLGHDGPQYQVDREFLDRPGLWIHCKDIQTLHKIRLEGIKAEYFFHHNDDCTLTSSGLVWTFPGKPFSYTSVAVALSEQEAKEVLRHAVAGVCTDYPEKVLQHQGFYQFNRSMALVFDLDGVLIESKDLHFQTFNQALSEIAGDKYTLLHEEHLALYDGLSTRQKLAKMTSLKGLPEQFHDDIFTRKQELTQAGFQFLPVDPEVKQTLQQLKNLGFLIGVASNCIRSSVMGLLQRIDVLDSVDVILSNEDVKQPKPFGEIYQLAAASFGLYPDQVIAIEDSKKGFEAVRRAGLSLIRVNSPAQVRVEYLLPKIAEIERKEQLVFTFPIAKRSRAFWTAGIEACPAEIPIQLADLESKPVIAHAIENLSVKSFQPHYAFVLQREMRKKYSLDSTLISAANYNQTSLFEVKYDQLGAAATCLVAKDEIDHRHLCISDGSHIIDWGNGSFEDFLRVAKSYAAVAAVIVHQEIDPRWSYVEKGVSKYSVSKIHEKVTVGELACAGTYYWDDGSIFIGCTNGLLSQKQKRKIFLSDVMNRTIELGYKVIYYPVRKVWSLRTLEEIQLYANARIAWKFDQINQEIVSRNQTSAICALEQKKITDGKCFAAYVLCEENWSASMKFFTLCSKIESICGSSTMVYSSRGKYQLHWTMLQLIKFGLLDRIQLPPDYAEIICSILANVVPKFEINFNQLVVTADACILVGIPTKDINHSREELRREMQQNDLPLVEPYRADAVHMTLARFTAPLSQHQLNQLLEYQNQHGQTHFGTLLVNRIQVSPATIAMQQEDLSDVLTVELN